MNEKIVDWFEDLIPEIKKSGDVKDVFLKFANKKNLAPALLERLGQIYNTAKTVNYLDKTASDRRGESFAILDVPDLLEAYTKEAGGSDYSNNDFASLKSDQSSRVPKDLFGGMTKDIALTPDFESEERIKLASLARSRYEKESKNKTNSETLDQLVFELKEDIRVIADDVFHEVSIKSANFSKVEQDALYYFEGTAKEACDVLAKYFDSKYLPVKRASNSGPKRIVENYKSLNLIGQLQNKLNELHVAKKADFQKSHLKDLTKEEKGLMKVAATPTVTTAPAPTPPTHNVNVNVSSPSRDTVSSPQIKKKDSKSEKSILGVVDAALERGIGSEGVQGAPGKFSEGLQKLIQGFADKENVDQKEYDLEMRDVEHAAILQNLMATDDILSEEDPQKVIDAYNTLRQLAPEMAGDINIARVTLRSMVQHEGLSFFDANTFSKAELDKAKVDNNIKARQDVDYGKKDDRENVQKRLAV